MSSHEKKPREKHAPCSTVLQRRAVSQGAAYVQRNLAAHGFGHRADRFRAPVGARIWGLDLWLWADTARGMHAKFCMRLTPTPRLGGLRSHVVRERIVGIMVLPECLSIILDGHALLVITTACPCLSVFVALCLLFSALGCPCGAAFSRAMADSFADFH